MKNPEANITSSELDELYEKATRNLTSHKPSIRRSARVIKATLEEVFCERFNDKTNYCGKTSKHFI